MKRFDLMQQINVRGTFMVTKECLPYLKKSSHAHVVIMTPPIILDGEAMEDNIAYLMSKYGMGLCVVGMAKEFEKFSIGVNGLWPRTTIWTKAVEVVRGADFFDFSRSVDIMADATYAILLRNPKKCSGKFFIDEEILAEEGVTDFTKYRCNPEVEEKSLAILGHVFKGKL